MEKDIDRISKNPDTDIVVRIDDFGGKVGLTIREFVKSERYAGFTKAGTRVPADKFEQFKKAINAINPKDLEAPSAGEEGVNSAATAKKAYPKNEAKQGKQESFEDFEDSVM